MYHDKTQWSMNLLPFSRYYPNVRFTAIQLFPKLPVCFFPLFCYYYVLMLKYCNIQFGGTRSRRQKLIALKKLINCLGDEKRVLELNEFHRILLTQKKSSRLGPAFQYQQEGREFVMKSGGSTKSCKQIWSLLHQHIPEPLQRVTFSVQTLSMHIKHRYIWENFKNAIYKI